MHTNHKNKKERTFSMALGLGSLAKKTKKPTAKSGKSGKSNKSAKNEATDMLKKMDAKAAAGDCPFC
jgi:hypothetical protein